MAAVSEIHWVKRVVDKHSAQPHREILWETRALLGGGLPTLRRAFWDGTGNNTFAWSGSPT